MPKTEVPGDTLMPQSLAAVFVHLVYSTKNREPFLLPQIEPELYAYQGRIFQEMGCQALIINGTADHLHTLFSLSRTVTLCGLVEEVKKRSSKWLKGQGEAFATFQWQVGYGAFSIGKSGVPALRQYIAHQKEHHRRQTFQEELREILAKYEIEYDERYVWD
jgi:REP element-mobilizing transposase RayT